MTLPLLNHHLFSEAYLSELFATPLAPDIPAAAQQTMREWREEYPDLAGEAALSSYLGQCLSVLGFAYQRQEGYFLLYADETFAQPLGLLLVADDEVGRMTKGRHHQARLVKLLKERQLAWGMLANGHDWRLCHAKAAAPYEVYLQADLDALLDSRQLAGFLQFYRFFSRQAFKSLDAALAASEAATQAIERHLKNRVDNILQALCLGFVEDETIGAGLGKHESSAQPSTDPSLSRADLDEIYRNAIVLLYRTLFLFYAEARQLLPVEEAAYRQYSLESIVEEARAWQVDGQRSADPYRLWGRLATLCGIVDLGDQDAGVSPYNGGLFSDAEHPYLRRHRLCNDYLAPAIYYLAFIEGKKGLARIEYRDLSVRHLGTLYEGMLEYRLNLVRIEPVVVREAKGKRVYIPQSIAQPKKGETILPVGQVYFADDKGERKSSGSYYTPEDVVQYIVGNTLGPKLEALAAPLRQQLEQALHERQVAASPGQRAAAESYADRQALELVENTLLRLKILDPAMGSAHFLVAAAQRLTDFIVELLNEADWPNEAISSDPLLWKRRVVERCLYGVDVNPLAQELAKLSLWLSSAAAGKPLTFLDHHLKVGNSLYGAPLEQLSTLPTAKNAGGDAEVGTQDMFHQWAQRTLQAMLDELGHINAGDSEHIEDVKHKGEAYQRAMALAARLRALANVWLSTLFTAPAQPATLSFLAGETEKAPKTVSEGRYFEWLQAAAQAQTPEEWAAYADGQPLLQAAQDLAGQERFFHWELEFPDAVVGERCQFDVVIANPPYVGTSPNAVIKKLFVTASCGDLYAWIYERALQVLGEEGSTGIVIPLSIAFAKAMTPLREILLNKKLHIRASFYDNRPEGLFNADKTSSGTNTENRQRTSIIIAKAISDFPTIIETTDFVQSRADERHLLFTSLFFGNTTSIASKAAFPKIGKSVLISFWEIISSASRKISDLVIDLYSESRRPPSGSIFLTIPRAAYHNVTAVPGSLDRNKVLSASFSNQNDLKLAQILLNSNIFFWYWRAFGDGFLLGTELIGAFPVPDDLTEEYLKWANKLDSIQSECVTYSTIRGKSIPGYNFNKRLDVLLEIDDFIVSHVAPDLGLPRDIFAQYKSNSFLHPLDLNFITTEEPEDVE